MGREVDSGRDRGAVQIADVFVGLVILVMLMVLAPHFYHFIGMAVEEADPFSQLLLRFVVPSLFIAFVLGIGRSARRGEA